MTKGRGTEGRGTEWNGGDQARFFTRISDETSGLMEKKEPDDDIKDIDKFRDELDDCFEKENDEVKNISNFDTNPLIKLNVKPSKVLESKQGMLSKSKQFLCPNCPNKFATRIERNKHKTLTHSELTHFVCDQCGKT